MTKAALAKTCFVFSVAIRTGHNWVMHIEHFTNRTVNVFENLPGICPFSNYGEQISQ
jgi:hypothetical protein